MTAKKNWLLSHPELMQTETPSPEESKNVESWSKILEWAKAHYRDRTFQKDEIVPTRPGLLYLVQEGAIRLVSKAQVNPIGKYIDREKSDLLRQANNEEAFLGFIGAGEPFEIVSHCPFTMYAYAHGSPTSVVWLYWHDLDNWGNFRQEVLEAFRHQLQRKQIWLSTLGQKRTIDRLWGFLTLLVEEYGIQTAEGYYLPYALTHAQISTAIGSTRVTVTRLMGKLRQQGCIDIKDENLIYLRTVHQQ